MNIVMALDFFNKVRMSLVLISVTLLVYLFVINKKGKNKKLPPGPFAWPILGNYLEYASNTHVKLAKLKQKYGDICSGKVGSMNIIVLNSAEAIKEAYNKSEFLGKTPHPGFNVYEHDSVFFSNDLDLWQEQRGFVIRSMRDFGLGKVKLEEEIQDEICRLFEYLEKHSAAPIHFVKILQQSAANNVLVMVMGKRFNYNDQVLTNLIKAISDYLKCMSRSGMYLSFPWIKYIAPVVKLLPNIYGDCVGYENSKINFKKVWKNEFLAEHKKTFNSENIRDFFDSYLQEIHKKGENSTFSEDILISTSIEFIGAGTETSAHCIMWCLYAIAANPDIKGKLLKEIEDVVGLTRMPSMSDQKLMPYTQAFINEIIRWSTILPIAPLRYTTKDTILGGYNIPKNTAVLANIWGVHHDPEVWDEPDAIKPERFLEPDGKTLKKHSSYIPFSVGRRKCPGEAMAYMEVFLYVASMLQRFDINFCPGEKPTFESEVIVSSRPKTFPIRVTSRTSSLNINFH